MTDSPSLDDLRIDRSERPSGGGGRRAVTVIVVLTFLLLAAAAVWWLLSEPVQAVATAPVRALEQGATPTASTVLDASGYVTARRRATVSSKITAKVTEVLVEEGMRVDVGQVMARLDDTIPARQLALAQAETATARQEVLEIDANLNEARLTLQRTQALTDSGVSTAAELDAARARVESLTASRGSADRRIEVAERRLALRRQELEDTIIRAPFAGVVVSKDAQPGEMISPVTAGGGFTRTGIGTVVDMTSLEIEVDVNEAYINRVRAAQPVIATLDAYPDWQIPATVITPVPTADRQKATVRVRIRFDELDERILPDMGVKVSFLEDEREAPATSGGTRLVIPSSALRSEEDWAVVFVLQGDQVERRAVGIGAARNGETEVSSGLNAGELVVLEPPPGLADGDRVAVR